MKAQNIKAIHCRDAATCIRTNLDENINSPLCRAIKKHLQECPHCSTDLAVLKKTITLYRRYPLPKHSPARHKNLMTKISSMR